MSLKKTIASLSVVLGSDTKPFEKGMNKGKSELQQFASAAKNMAKVAAGAFAAVGASALAAAGKAAEYADEIDKTAISTGLSRESLQKLRYVADQAGVDFGNISKAVARLTKTMGDVEYGSVRQVEAFEALGLSIYDATGNMKSMEVMFPEVISRLNTMQNETERNALAMEIFGRSANEIVPRLAYLGDEGMGKLMDKANKLNLVLSDDAVAALVAYKDNMSTLKQQFGAIMREGIVPFAAAMSEKMIPLMSGVLEKISLWQKKRLADTIAKEKVELNSLATALMSANDNERLRANLIDEINTKYPNFLKGLSDEEIGVRNIRDRLKEANAQYVQRIKLLALESQAQEVTTDGVKLANREMKLAEQIASAARGGEFGILPPQSAPIWEMVDGKKTITSNMQEIAEYFSTLENNEETLRAWGNPAKGYLLGLRQLGKTYLDIQLEIEANAKAHAELIQKSQELTEKLNELIEQSGNLTGGKGSGGKDTSQTTTTSSVPANIPKPGNIDFSGLNNFSPAMEGIKLADGELIKFQGTIQSTQATIVDFSETVQTAFADMAYNLGESIGNIITGQANFDSFFQSILEGFGKFAQDMGKLITAYGFSMVAFKKAFANPWAAIAAGGGLVAVGTMIRNAAQSPNVSGAGTAMASGYTSGYNSQPSTQRIELVWKRAGKDLVAIINQENNSLNTLTAK